MTAHVLPLAVANGTETAILARVAISRYFARCGCAAARESLLYRDPLRDACHLVWAGFRLTGPKRGAWRRVIEPGGIEFLENAAIDQL